MGEYLIDMIILALLALFGWRGWAKGLVLSLCGLVAVFVAFFSAQFLSDQFCTPVSNILRPIIIQTVRGADAEPAANPADPESTYTVDELLASIQEKGLFEGFSAFLEEGVKSNAVEQSDRLSPLEALASYLAQAAAKALLFGIVFISVMVAWFLVSHALDLAFQLPILSEVNTIGGLIIGLVKGALLTVVGVWLAQVAGFIPNPPDTPVVALFTVDRLWELLSTLPG